MKRASLLAAAIVLLAALSHPTQAQWQDGNLAIRTNSNIFQPGDKLKVELLSLERINDTFYTQVSYRYSELETVEEKDADGNVTTKQVSRERIRRRNPGPSFENMEALRSIVLDDSFNFSEDSPSGQYIVEVALFRTYTKEPVATLRSYVFFQEVAEASPMFLRSFKQAFTNNYLAFDGMFPTQGRYSAVLLSGNTIIKHLKTGAYTSGRREFHILSEQLNNLAGRTFDVLIHDHLSGTSSTLARVTIPATQ